MRESTNFPSRVDVSSSFHKLTEKENDPIAKVFENSVSSTTIQSEPSSKQEKAVWNLTRLSFDGLNAAWTHAYFLQNNNHDRTITKHIPKHNTVHDGRYHRYSFRADILGDTAGIMGRSRVPFQILDGNSGCDWRYRQGVASHSSLQLDRNPEKLSHCQEKMRRGCIPAKTISPCLLFVPNEFLDVRALFLPSILFQNSEASRWDHFAGDFGIRGTSIFGWISGHCIAGADGRPSH